jgi:hypothetical protein
LKVAGFVVQAVGIVIAARGLQQTKRGLFPGRPLPPGRWWQVVRTRVLRRRPPGVVVKGTAAEIAVVGRGFGRVTRGQPAVDADDAAWRMYLVARLDDLGREVDQVRERTDKVGEAAERRMLGVSDEVRAVEARLESRVKEAVGGPQGTGIDLQFWGSRSR